MVEAVQYLWVSRLMLNRNGIVGSSEKDSTIETYPLYFPAVNMGRLETAVLSPEYAAAAMPSMLENMWRLRWNSVDWKKTSLCKHRKPTVNVLFD